MSIQHPQFEGYELGTPIKQADTVLLGYPLEYEMARSTRENNLRFYEPVTRIDGPAMTWGMHAINYVDIADLAEAERFLYRSFREYIREPFNVWCEVGPEFVGAINFITGAGGFLQVILNGYAGIRPKVAWLQVNKPTPLPLTGDGSMSVEGLKYMGSRYNIFVNSTVSQIIFTEVSDERPLKVVYDDGNEGAVSENVPSKFLIFVVD